MYLEKNSNKFTKVKYYTTDTVEGFQNENTFNQII